MFSATKERVMDTHRHIGGCGRGQSTVVGFALLIGLVVVGAAIVLLAGSTALADTQQQAELERATHTMTLLDSRAAMVALGDAESQSVSLESDAGEYTVHEDRGWLKIEHTNFSRNGNTEVMFNRTLGSLVYDQGQTEIAYQGGGVWQRGENGGSTMLSPPEFHYRDETLTLPVVRVGSGYAGGDPSRINVQPRERARHVYPNATGPTAGDETGAPYNVTDGPYDNPVRNGTVTITVHSRYYLGWAAYFSTRTEGDVRLDAPNETVELELGTTAVPIGDFQMPMEGNGLDIRSIDGGHPLDAFTLTLEPDGHYSNMHWGMYVDDGNQGFEFHFHSSNPGQCKANPTPHYDGELRLSVYYFDTRDGATVHEEWYHYPIDPNSNPNYNISCPSGELMVDLTADTPMTYDDIETMPGVSAASNKWVFGSQIKSESITNSTDSFDVHPEDTGQYAPGGTEELGFVINHYMGLLGPDYELTVTDGPGGSSRVDEGASGGELRYDIASGAQYVRYLHVTENQIVIDAS
jgi:hypothetical protein